MPQLILRVPQTSRDWLNWRFPSGPRSCERTGTGYFVVRILSGFLMYGHLGPHSHAWLELGEFQIDITADQFVRDHEKELWGGRPGDLREGVMGISEPATRPDIPRRLRGVYCP